jgi:lysophospholipase L1-like esterase
MTTRSTRAALGAVLALALLAAAACSSDDHDAEARRSSGDQLHLPITLEAMGDSFSSGAGAPPYDATGTACYRGPAAWARRLATDSPAGVESIEHVACGGATAADLVAAQGTGLKAQLPTRPDPSISVVTFTIGGNDIQFGSIVTQCVVYRCPKPDDANVRAALSTLERTLVDTTYPALQRAFPNARLVHVGYPRLTPAAGQDIVGCAWLSGGDRTAAEGIIQGLDDTIAAAARRAGDVSYVDVFTALAGHELCSHQPWVVPIGGATAAHPTAAGYQALEVRIAEALGLPLEP